MKVLYLTHPYKYGSGGERRSFEVLRRVSRYGIEPVIVTEQSLLNKLCEKDLLPFFSDCRMYFIKRPYRSSYARFFRSVSRLGLLYLSILKVSSIICDIAEREQVELIVSHHENFDYILEARIAAAICALPWTCVLQLPVIPVYISTIWRKISLPRKIYLKAIYFLFYRFLLKSLNQNCLAVSPSINIEMRHYLSGWKGNFIVLQPGVGVENKWIRAIKPSKELADAVFYARLVPEKGIFDIPKIWYEVVCLKPDAKLVIIGRFGSLTLRKEFINMIRYYGLEENIVYKGYLPEDELFSIVKSSKVLIYPSRHDAFPLVVLEALACGTPVVAYNIPALKLNYRDLNSVRLAPTGDYKRIAAETIKIIENKNLRDLLSKKALLFASNFSWEDAVKEEVHAYEKVI